MSGGTGTGGRKTGANLSLAGRRREFVIAAAAVVVVAAWGCGRSAPSRAEFEKHLQTVFEKGPGDTWVLAGGPVEVREKLGEPASMKAIGGTSEEWTYRHSDGATVLRFNFQPERKDDEGRPLPPRVVLLRAQRY